MTQTTKKETESELFFVPRTGTWYSAFEALTIALDTDTYYPESYSNDIFELRQYYSGGCTCEYDKKARKFAEENEHEDDCYLSDFNKLEKQFCDEFNIKSIIDLDRNQKLLFESKLCDLYKKYDLSYNKKNPWQGCGVICTCSYDKHWHKFLAENDHSDDCMLTKHNFLYKPTGFYLDWYKYPLRGSYMNMDLNIEQFKEIISICIKSLKESK